MTNSLFKHLSNITVPNSLSSKVFFDKLEEEVETTKPEFGDSGFVNTRDSAQDEITHNGKHATPIIAIVPNFHKERGTIVSDEGFIKLPRSLLNDPHWKGMRSKYQKVFLILLFHTSYTQKSYSIGANLVTIGPGQFCTSIRTLVDLCNEGVKFKEDCVDKNIVERSVSLFTKIGFVRQEVRHKKSIFTITYPELYEHFQSQSETQSETKPRHNRDTNEERKERKDMKETIDGAAAPVRSSLLNNQKNEEKQSPSAFDAPSAPTRKNEKLTPEQEKQYKDIWAYLCKTQMAEGYTLKNAKGQIIKGVSPKDVVTWLKTKDFKEIVEAIKITNDANVQTNFPGYVVSVFKKNVVAKKSNLEINDAFFKEFIKIHKCTHLEDTKQYVQDLIKHIDYQKNLDPARFKEMIESSLRMAESYEDREYKEEEY